MEERSSVKWNKGWALLLIAGSLEPAWVVSMKLSEGFTHPIWAIATAIFLFGSMASLAKALKYDIPMGTAYSVWVGIGAIGALIAGIMLFDESSNLLRLGFILVVIVGIMGLQATSGKEG